MSTVSFDPLFTLTFSGREQFFKGFSSPYPLTNLTSIDQTTAYQPLSTTISFTFEVELHPPT
jgi:hypothetical protein